ncbi:efflux RND transporter periplasmic adaptor subunit [Glaciecola siphonariae]|uniref:Efflux RND transporter periplasmic adaptor subunit n=1 Tax=Glaciecola siphonariae TaxID=521012 RepID=A0ABV9LY95_9ALTE
MAQSKMVQLKRWLLTLLMLVCIIAALGFVKFTQIKAAIAFGESFPEPSETVQTMQVSAAQWQPKLEVIGEIKAIRSVELRNEFEGIITKVAFPSGGRVNKGDLLVQLDIAPELAQLEAINAEIELAKLDVKRFSDLLEVRASSKDQFDRANSQLMVNRARARALQATIDRKTILAPFSGTTSIHDWEVGTYIAANSVITRLVGDLDSVWVDFSVPQWQSNIEIGSKVNVAAPSLINAPLEATISAVNQQIASGSRSVLVRAKLNNTIAKFKPGTIVKVLFPIDEYQQVFPIPNEALRFDTFGSYVYVLNKDDKGDYRAKRRPVSVVTRELDKAMVTQGIETGETIATVGSAKLSEGLLVFSADQQASRSAEAK